MADEENGMTEELGTLREELESLKREKEVLRGELEAALALRNTEVAGLKQAMAESEQKLTEIKALLAQAVASYREMVTAAHPEIPPEFIAGDSVAAVDQSLQSAQALVDKVKQGIEAETARARVPAGAPPRAPFDLSALSPREKIQYAIGGKR